VCEILPHHDHGEILEGIFYAEEIQKVIKQDDVYKIQSVLKKTTERKTSTVFSKVARYVRCTSCADIVSLPVLSPRIHPNLTSPVVV
jgi:hypothetical protein